MTALHVDCPAGLQVGTGSPYACHCRIENSVIREQESPRALAAYCFGSYMTCPTWRAHKDAIREEREREFVRDLGD